MFKLWTVKILKIIRPNFGLKYRKSKKFSNPYKDSFITGTIYRLNQYFCRKFHRLGKEFWLDLPTEGGAIIVCNHQSIIDTFPILAASKRKLRFFTIPQRYDKRIIGFFSKKFNSICIDRKKSNEAIIRQSIRAVKNGDIIVIFPFGGYHVPEQKRERKIRRGAAIIAKIAQVPIYSIYISGFASTGNGVKKLFYPRHKLCIELKSVKYCYSSNIDVIMKEMYRELSNKVNNCTL